MVRYHAANSLAPSFNTAICRPYTPERDYQFVETNRQLRALHPKIVGAVIEGIVRHGGSVVGDAGSDLITINQEFTVSIVIARCRCTAAGTHHWLIRLDTGLSPDITVAVRMDEPNEAPLDYYLLPRIDVLFEKLRLKEDNGLGLDVYRFDALEFFLTMTERTKIAEAA